MDVLAQCVHKDKVSTDRPLSKDVHLLATSFSPRSEKSFLRPRRHPHQKGVKGYGQPLSIHRANINVVVCPVCPRNVNLNANARRCRLNLVWVPMLAIGVLALDVLSEQSHQCAIVVCVVVKVGCHFCQNALCHLIALLPVKVLSKSRSSSSSEANSSHEGKCSIPCFGL